MVSNASRASRLADFSRSRRAVSAWLTLSFARLIAAPLVLRSSGDILPSVALRRQRGLGLFGNRLERRRLVNGEIGQNLAVDRDARLGQAVDEDAVGHAEGTNRGIEALDPQRAESALLALAVAEGVLPGLLDRGLGGTDGVLAAAVKTLGGLVDFLVLGVRGHTAFDARHDGSPLISGIGDGLQRERGSAKWDGIALLRSGDRQERFLEIVAGGLEHHAGAAKLTNLLLGPLDHAVALAALGGHHFAGGSHLEALFGA